jgi:hypothetical protein
VQTLADTHDTSLSTLLARADPLSGLGTADHAVPFHDSTSVLAPDLPTAVQVLGDTHDTELSRLAPAAGLGLGTTDHAVPFQDSTSVFSPALDRVQPTAVQAVADTHQTPSRTPLTFGLGTIDHLVPFHDSTSAPPDSPTAVQALADTHDTPLRKPPWPLFPGGTTDQLVPFHDSISLLTPVSVNDPTAVHALADTHDTPARPFLCPLGFGLGTTDQVNDPVCTARWDTAGPPAASAGPADDAATTSAAQTAKIGRGLRCMTPSSL